MYHPQVVQAKGLADGTQLILRIPDLVLNLKLPAIQTPGPAQARQARLCHRRLMSQASSKLHRFLSGAVAIVTRFKMSASGL